MATILMRTKSAAVIVPPTSSEREAAINRGRAMREIMENLDKDGELSKRIDDYWRKLESYSGRRKPKSQATRAARKK